MQHALQQAAGALGAQQQPGAVPHLQLEGIGGRPGSVGGRRDAFGVTLRSPSTHPLSPPSSPSEGPIFRRVSARTQLLLTDAGGSGGASGTGEAGGTEGRPTTPPGGVQRLSSPSALGYSLARSSVSASLGAGAGAEGRGALQQSSPSGGRRSTSPTQPLPLPETRSALPPALVPGGGSAAAPAPGGTAESSTAAGAGQRSTSPARGAAASPEPLGEASFALFPAPSGAGNAGKAAPDADPLAASAFLAPSFQTQPPKLAPELTPQLAAPLTAAEKGEAAASLAPGGSSRTRPPLRKTATFSEHAQHAAARKSAPEASADEAYFSYREDGSCPPALPSLTRLNLSGARAGEGRGAGGGGCQAPPCAAPAPAPGLGLRVWGLPDASACTHAQRVAPQASALASLAHFLLHTSVPS